MAPTATRPYTVEVPVTATVLDALDVVKDQRDGTLAYRKSCRMAVCGSCGMRVDGGAVLGCKTSMKPFVDAGHVITVAPMGNLPVIKDLVVDMEPFWRKVRAVKPYLDAHDEDAGEKEWRVRPEQQEAIHKESLCIMCGCCVSECNSMEADPDFLGPAALAKAYRFVGDVRDLDTRDRLRDLNGAHGIWDCTRCYFCNQRCPKGVDPRDAIAKLGAESFDEGITRDEGAKHARVFVVVHVPRRLPARDGARAEDDRADRRDARGAARPRAGPGRQGAEPARAAQGEGQRRGAPPLEAAGAGGEEPPARARRACQRRPERGLTRCRTATRTTPAASPACRRRSSTARRGRSRSKLEVELIDMPSVTCCGAGDIHEAKPDYYLHLSARILGQAERTGAEVLLTICNVCTLNLRQANKRLQEDAQELARINDNLREVGAATYAGGVEVRHLLWEVSQGEGYERFKQVAVRSLEGLQGRAVLRLPDPAPGQDARLRGSRIARSRMERLIEACGAEPIDYPAKIKCCGFPIILAREDVALGELIQPLHEATEAGADVMVTPCPLCHLSLDAWQKKAARPRRRALQPAGAAPGAAARRGGGHRRGRAAVQAPHRAPLGRREVQAQAAVRAPHADARR